MSCEAWKNSVAPGTAAISRRSRAITSVVEERSEMGFNEANTKPPLVWPPPVKPTTLATALSLWMMSMYRVSFWDMSWNEML